MSGRPGVCSTDRCRCQLNHKAPAKKKQVTLAAAFSTVVPYDKKGWQAITDAVTHYIAKGMVLIYTVEKKRFYYDAANYAPLFLVC